MRWLNSREFICLGFSFLFTNILQTDNIQVSIDKWHQKQWKFWKGKTIFERNVIISSFDWKNDIGNYNLLTHTKKERRIKLIYKKVESSIVWTNPFFYHHGSRCLLSFSSLIWKSQELLLLIMALSYQTSTQGKLSIPLC